MTTLRLSVLVLAAACAALPSWAQAPAVADPTMQPLTRAQVKMDRDEFLKTHRWDEPSATWMLKKGVEPPTGVKSRAEVKAARDLFLANNRWDESRGGWTPLNLGPRNMGTLSRAAVRAETAQFMRTHQWDEQTEVWVLRGPRNQAR
jgi:hypothetical protein